jgi:hypothetical protein
VSSRILASSALAYRASACASSSFWRAASAHCSSSCGWVGGWSGRCRESDQHGRCEGEGEEERARMVRGGGQVDARRARGRCAATTAGRRPPCPPPPPASTTRAATTPRALRPVRAVATPAYLLVPVHLELEGVHPLVAFKH